MTRIRWDFIDELEGGMRLDGYVPDDPDKKSGVTIGSGVDLGWLKQQEFLQLPAPMQSKLKPYIGLRGDAAIKALSATPLKLERDDINTLMDVERRAFIAEVSARYTHDAKSAFSALPDGAATVIMSVAYQYGDPWADLKCGKFWAVACQRDWSGLATQLRNFPDRRFITRRKREAVFLGLHITRTP
jgi:hypothetical protein